MMQGHLFLRVMAMPAPAEGRPSAWRPRRSATPSTSSPSASGCRPVKSLEATRDTDTSAMGQPVLGAVAARLPPVPTPGPSSTTLGSGARRAAARAHREAVRAVSIRPSSLGDPAWRSATAEDSGRGRAMRRRAEGARGGGECTSAEGRMGVAEARGTDGSRLIELYFAPARGRQRPAAGTRRRP